MFDHLIRHVVLGDTEFTIVRPGLTLCLLYAKPAEKLAPAIANILEAYIAFVPQGVLQTYLSADGTWKHANNRTLNSTLKKLRSTGSGHYAEFHFGQEPLGNVGEYGAHFKGSPLNDDYFPLKTCSLYLEFPLAFSEVSEANKLAEFVKKIALMCESDSGYCGYAFNHLHMRLRAEAFGWIGKVAMRYIGFDVPNDVVSLDALGRVCNVSWLSLFGAQITDALGGITAIRQGLPETMTVLQLGAGVLVRAAETPIVGDVNRGAKDAAPLRSLAALTRKVRVQAPNLGPDDPDFAERWLGRFDAS